MAGLDITNNIASLVKKDLSSALIFAKYGLNFAGCGNLTLGQSCQEAGIDPETVLQELNSIAQTEPTSGQFHLTYPTIKLLTEDIVKVHHSFLRKILPQITDEIDALSPRESFEEAKNLFSKIRSNIENHSIEEEKQVFPIFNLIEEDPEKIENTDSLYEKVRTMEIEHGSCGLAMRSLKLLCNNYVLRDRADLSLTKLIRSIKLLDFDLQIHIHKENNLLHPMVKEKLHLLQAAKPCRELN